MRQMTPKRVIRVIRIIRVTRRQMMKNQRNMREKMRMKMRKRKTSWAMKSKVVKWNLTRADFKVTSRKSNP